MTVRAETSTPAREIWELAESADVREFVADLRKIMATVVRS